MSRRLPPLRSNTTRSTVTFRAARIATPLRPLRCRSSRATRRRRPTGRGSAQSPYTLRMLTLAISTVLLPPTRIPWADCLSTRWTPGVGLAPTRVKLRIRDVVVEDVVMSELSTVQPPLDQRVAPFPSRTRFWRRPTARLWSIRYTPPALNTIVEPLGTLGSQLLRAALASSSRSRRSSTGRGCRPRRVSGWAWASASVPGWALASAPGWARASAWSQQARRRGMPRRGTPQAPFGGRDGRVWRVYGFLVALPRGTGYLR